MSNHFYTPSLYYLYFSKVRKREINRTLSSLSLSLFLFFFIEEKRGYRTCFQRDLNFDKALATSQHESKRVNFYFYFLFFFLPFILISAQWFIDFCQGWRLKKAWKEWEESMEKGSVLHNRIYEKFGRNMKYNSGIFYF